MTLADKELKEYERDITVIFKGDTYPLYVLMEKLLRIIDKDGNCVPFILNFQQVKAYKEMCEQRRRHEPIRFNILKARQLGMSTFIAGVFFLITMYTPNWKSGVIADKQDHAENIFDKYKFFYEHLDDSNPAKEEINKFNLDPKNKGKKHPLSYKPQLVYNKGKQYLETIAHSIIEVLVAGESSGRSGTYNALHLSEVAFFPNLNVTLRGLLATVSRKNLNSMVFLETTANGFNEYKDRRDMDYARKTNYIGFFIPRFDNPDYAEKCDKLPLMEEWLYEKQKQYNLTNEQMAYYLGLYYEAGSDKNGVLQEYPFCPTDAFISTGNCLFGIEQVAMRKEEVSKNLFNVKQGFYTYDVKFSRDGKNIELKSEKFIEARNGAIKIYKEPDPYIPYVGICDPNNGGADDCAIQIIDNTTGEQVAVLKTNEYPLDKVAFQFYVLGKKYNWALLSSEMNLGQSVMDYLLKLHYPKLYITQNQIFNDYKQRLSNKYGHKITPVNRDTLIQSFRIAFRENPYIINDYDTLCQMETFQNVRHEAKGGKITYKMEALGGNHDDLIMAYIAFFEVRRQQSMTPYEIALQKGKKYTSFEEFEKDYLKKRREKFNNSNSNSVYRKKVGIDFGNEYFRKN